MPPRHNSVSSPDSPEHTHKLKLIIIGLQNSGKTSIAERFFHNTFYDNPQSTQGANFRKKLITHDDQSIELSVWDTPGQTRLMPIFQGCFTGTDGCFLVVNLKDLGIPKTRFDLTSFEKQHLPFVNLLKEHWDEDKQLQIIINKADLAGTGDYVDLKTAEKNLKTWMDNQDFFTGKNITIHIYSAKEDEVPKGNINKINTVFESFARDICKATQAAVIAAASDGASSDGPKPSKGLDKIKTSADAIAHFKKLFDDCDAGNKRSMKPQVLIDLRHLIANSLMGNEYNKELFAIHKALQGTLQSPEKNTALVEVVRESGCFRRTFGRTNTYQQMSKIIATELARRELQRFKDQLGTNTSINNSTFKLLEGCEDKKIFTKCHYRGPQFWRSAAKNQLRDDISKLDTKEQRTKATELFLSK